MASESRSHVLRGHRLAGYGARLAGCQITSRRRPNSVARRMAIRAALLGTGIFSKDVYSRIIAEHADRVTLHTVWSRSQASAEEFGKK